MYFTTVIRKSRRLSTFDIADRSDFGLVPGHVERIAPLELFGIEATVCIGQGLDLILLGLIRDSAIKVTETKEWCS